MVFSDTTNKNGMIQRFEWWTRMKDGDVTGVLLQQVTAAINDGFDSIIPFLLSYSDRIRWDDFNHTDRPIGTIDIVSGQPDYTVSEDDNGLDILNLTRVRILNSASATDYTDLRRMFINDIRAADAMSPNPSFSGIPSHFLEVGNSIFLYPNPNYAATAGVKLFFERQQSYFVSTDTTKEIGIPRTFHILPVLYAAEEWILINRSKDTATINRIGAKIVKKEQQLNDMISMRNPTRGRFIVSRRTRDRGAESGRLSLRAFGSFGHNF